MVGPRRHPDHRILAQPGAQPVEQGHGRCGVVARQETQVATRERRGGFAAQGDALHGRRQDHAGETFAQHRLKMRAVAGRLGQRATERRRFRPGACGCKAIVGEIEDERSHTQAPAQEPGSELVHQAIDREAERLDVAYGKRQDEPALEMRGRDERNLRVGYPSPGTIEDSDQCRPDAAGQRLARQRTGRAERRHAGMAQERHRGGVCVEMIER